MGDQYLEVYYEDLLQKPEAVLRQICAMLSIDFLPQMLELARPSENIGDAVGAKVIVADNLGKFSTRMSPAVLARIEAISGEAMLVCGYSLATPVQTTRRLARHEAWLAKLSDAYQLVRAERKNRGLVGAITFHARAAVLRRR